MEEQTPETIFVTDFAIAIAPNNVLIGIGRSQMSVGEDGIAFGQKWTHALAMSPQTLKTLMETLEKATKGQPE